MRKAFKQTLLPIVQAVILTLLAPTLSLAATAGQNADWYLYVWSDNTSSGGDIGQFVTTNTENVFVLNGITTTETGLKYCIHNSSWGTLYGWSQGSEGSVSATGVNVSLGPTSGATGWLGIDAGTYDVTFDANNLTIRFDVHYEEEGDNWYISGAFNNYGYGNAFIQSETNAYEYVIDGFTLSSDDLDSYGGFSFNIITPSWEKNYVCNSNISTLDYSYNFVLKNDGDDNWANAYCNALTAGTAYCLTWNKRNHTLTITESTSPTEVVINYITYPDGNALATYDDYLRGGDISMLNYVEDMGAKFYDTDGTEKDPLDIMQENGVNFVRLRLYNQPGNTVTYTSGNTTYSYALPSGHLDEEDVLKLARRAKARNMKIELTFHYSDFWTNGEMQFKPKAWENLSMAELKTAVHDYTYNFLQRMNAQGTTPDYVSLGNEIQGGLLFGYYTSDMGQINNVNGYCGNMANVAALLAQGSAAVREACPEAKVVIHLTLSESITTDTYKWFFDEMKTNNLDYDVIGASYYPFWTNQKPSMLNNLASTMYTRYGKDLLVMEVGYSWTPYRPSGRYGGDYEGQLHLNGIYNEASKIGQKSFMKEVQRVLKGNDHILGYLYWDPVMVEQKVNGSWIPTGWVAGGENQVGNTTWFDYDGKALPVLEAMAEDMVEVPSTVTIDGVTYTVHQQAPFTLNVSEVGFATFYDASTRTIPSGLTAYTAKSISTTQMHLTSIDGGCIPAETGVVVKGDAGTYYLWQTDETALVEGENLLMGTNIEISKPSGTVLTLAKENGNVGFYSFVGDKIPAHKAYLIPDNQAQALLFTFDEIPDGIEETQTFGKEEGCQRQVFDLQGRQVTGKLNRGVYIINNKKRFVR